MARQLMHELGVTQCEPTAQSTDNRGVFLQSTKQVNHAVAKHFRISQAFIRSKQDERIIKVQEVATGANGADFLTKALGKGPFLKHLTKVMGPQERPSQ